MHRIYEEDLEVTSRAALYSATHCSLLARHYPLLLTILCSLLGAHCWVLTLAHSGSLFSGELLLVGRA